MPQADATCICAEHVRAADAMRRCTYERTHELTHADASKTDQIPRVSNAHERWIETPSGLAKCPNCYPRENVA